MMDVTSCNCLSEGLKEKDKKLIMNVLSAIGLMKDQAYHLARHIWNDVHDDWPFYTDQEKQILKRYIIYMMANQSESHYAHALLFIGLCNKS